VEVLAHREELQVRVIVVSFAAPASLAAYRDGLGLHDAVLLSDVDRTAYAAFGFERGSLRRVWLDPRAWWHYAALLARGRRPERPQEDTLQLGGDVLVDPGGVVRWMRVESKTGTEASCGPTSRSISVHP
jgi:AhpC/TSA antioxidant enzyme